LLQQVDSLFFCSSGVILSTNMAVEIKVVQNQNPAAANSSMLRASAVYGQASLSNASVSGKPPPMGGINNALFAETNIANHRRLNTTQAHGSQIAYTKFKPVASYSTSSLIASLYKSSALGESKNLQTQQRLPNLYQNSRYTQTAANIRRRGLRSFTYPTYSAVHSPRYQHSNDQPPQSKVDTSYSGAKRTTSAITQAAAASETWTTVHASIAASGYGILPETTDPKPRPTSMTAGTIKPTLLHQPLQLPHRTSVNYVPFYEIRGRGDGASVVDAPSMDVEGIKIESMVASASAQKMPGAQPSDAENTHANIYDLSKYNTNVNEDHSKRKQDDWENSAQKQTDTGNPTRTPTNTNDETLDSLVSALIRRSHTGKGSSAATPTKAGKKVRFSSSVTTNRIEEPSYTEALLESLRNRIRNKKESHGSVSSHESKDNREKSDRASATSTSARDEDEPAFVTPVMKVVVTKRHGPTGAELNNAIQVSPQEPVASQQHSEGNPQRRVASMASRMINNYVSINPPNDVLRRGTQATRRASTARQAKDSEAIARVAKFVPKRQTVVMPNFPKPAAWPTRSFPSHPTSPRMRSTVAANSAFTAAVRGSSFEVSKPPAARVDPKQTRDNLRTRLKTSSGGIYISTSQNRRPSTTPASPEKSVERNAFPASKAAVSATQEEKLSGSATKYGSDATTSDFQPIPSMPDHINFCDPRKTELILRWLEDVNKKRNIESKLRRSATRRLRTVNQ